MFDGVLNLFTKHSGMSRIAELIMVCSFDLKQLLVVI
jgi:hypothetical protein